MQHIQFEPGKQEFPRSVAIRNLRRSGRRWRGAAHALALLLLVGLVVLAKNFPELNRKPDSDWRPLVSLAEKFWSAGDLYQARHLYIQIERLATWRDEWEGLVAAACGFYRLDGGGPHSKFVQLSIRAALAAEVAESRRGIGTVAKALALSGAYRLAAAVSARIRPHWPEVEDGDTHLLLETCLARAS